MPPVKKYGGISHVHDRLLDHRPPVVRAHLVPLVIEPSRVIAAASDERRRDADGQRGGRRAPSSRHISGRCARRHDRVRRQPVDLGLVEQQEERAEAADAVVRVAAVERAPFQPLGRELREPRVGALAQLVERAELDRVRRARLRARRLVAAFQPVVAERALPDAAVLFCREQARQRRRGCAAGAACRGRRTGRPARSSRSRCRCPPARRPCRTRCGRARRSGRRRGTPRACSACRRPTPSASAAARSPVVVEQRASRCSTNATWRHVFAPSCRVLS